MVLKNELLTAEISEGTIKEALDWTYDKAIGGIPGLDTVEELASSYISEDGDLYDQANALIRWQVAKAGTSGFLAGLGGAITMPVSIPANIASVIYVQMRMIAAIAYMGGHDLKDDKVKTLAYACLAGNEIKDVFKSTGILIGTKLTNQAIKSISSSTIVAINQKVGFRLLTKFGEKGAVNLGKGVPVVGGVIGGVFDSVTTNVIGNVARDLFIKNTIEPSYT